MVRFDDEKFQEWRSLQKGGSPLDWFRFFSYLKEEGDCLVWTGYKYPSGYGQFWMNGKRHLVHRVAWFFSEGEWPFTQRGLNTYDINHLCENKPCVKRIHLEHITRSEHAVFTMKSKDRICPEGHKKIYEPWNGNGRWTCKICKIDSQRRIRGNKPRKAN